MVVGALSLIQKVQTSGRSTQYTRNSGIWWWGHCPLCHIINSIHWFDLFAPRNNVSTAIYHYSTVHCIHWYDLFAPKTMSPPPHTTILLPTAYCIHCILWFDILHQRQYPHHHIPLFRCVLHPLHPLRPLV